MKLRLDTLFTHCEQTGGSNETVSLHFLFEPHFVRSKQFRTAVLFEPCFNPFSPRRKIANDENVALGEVQSTQIIKCPPAQSQKR